MKKFFTSNLWSKFSLLVILFNVFFVANSFVQVPMVQATDCSSIQDPSAPISGQSINITINNPPNGNDFQDDYRIFYSDQSIPILKLNPVGQNTTQHPATQWAGTLTNGLPKDGLYSYTVGYYFAGAAGTSSGIPGYNSANYKAACTGAVFVDLNRGSCNIDRVTGQNLVDNCNHTQGFNSSVTEHIIGSGNNESTYFTCSCVNGVDSSNSPGVNNGGFGSPATCNGQKGLDIPGFGCVSSNPSTLVNTFFNIALGLAGGVAILFIIIGGFKVATSAGDPDALEEGRSTITAAIIGLVFVLLATVILGIIGVDILGISFFQKSGNDLIINK